MPTEKTEINMLELAEVEARQKITDEQSNRLADPNYKGEIAMINYSSVWESISDIIQRGTQVFKNEKHAIYTTTLEGFLFNEIIEEDQDPKRFLDVYGTDKYNKMLATYELMSE